MMFIRPTYFNIPNSIQIDWEVCERIYPQTLFSHSYDWVQGQGHLDKCQRQVSSSI